MRNKSLSLVFVSLFIHLVVLSQKNTDDGYILWSADDRLTVDDLNFRKADSTHAACNAVFIMQYYKPLFSFKSYNKLFTNSMLKSASWIDTSLNVSFQITYLQTLFDIQEIYTRQWRQAFSEKFFDSKRNLKKTQDKALADAIARQEKYRAEILYAKGPEVKKIQEKWEAIIKNELNSLIDFAYKKRPF